MASSSPYGPQVSGETGLRARCRLLQSKYRHEVLGEAFGVGPNRDSKSPFGNFLVDGERTGSNFLYPYAFRYAHEKALESWTNPDLTLEPYRLFNNMLSSMPMCFNLFAQFRESVILGDGAALRMLQAAFPELPIARVLTVEVEYIPRPIERYTGDKSAMDAAVLFEDEAGRRGIIAIETKYTDALGKNRAKDNDRKWEFVEKSKMLNPEGVEYHQKRGFDQLMRNVLLTESYRKAERLGHSLSVVLAPAEDGQSAEDVERLRGRLAKRFRERVGHQTLETFVERAAKVAPEPYLGQLRRFGERYFGV